MARTKIFHLFLGYVALILFGSIWLSLKYLSDLADCQENSKKEQSSFPHQSDIVHNDPWNVNDHHVTYGHRELYEKKRRGIVKPNTEPPLLQQKEKATKKRSPSQNVKENQNNDQDTTEDDFDDLKYYSPHHLAIIVPFRDRFEELQEFVPHMHKYLTEKGIAHKIYIVNQADKHRFNRASLINVGFVVARNESNDYIAMHDVDLLPLNKDLDYGYPDNGPFHVAAPHLHPKYHYKKFVGGILILSVEQFEAVNGLSNNFWGWGREDDELYLRMVEAGYTVQRHGMEIATGYNTFKHEHDSEKRPRDYKRLYGQKKASFKRDTETGFNDVQYNIVNRHEFTIDGSPCTVLDVFLNCDKMVTPWCDFPSKKRQ